jgi:hypothetical protein
MIGVAMWRVIMLSHVTRLHPYINKYKKQTTNNAYTQTRERVCKNTPTNGKKRNNSKKRF